MRVAIYACEQMYGGLHGMEDFLVVDVDSAEEADQIGEEMSLDIMQSYSCIIDTLEEDAAYYGDELMRQNTEWIVYPLNELANEHSVDELTQEFYNDRNEFLETYFHSEAE